MLRIREPYTSSYLKIWIYATSKAATVAKWSEVILLLGRLGFSLDKFVHGKIVISSTIRYKIQKL